MKTYEEIKALYEAYREVQAKPIEPVILADNNLMYDKLPTDTVIDPNQSVNWNHQMVELYNEALENNRKTKRDAWNKAYMEYMLALDEFLINDPNYGNGKLTRKKLQQIRNFMYDECEDTYNYTNGFDNYMCLIRHLIDLVVR